jgi:phosphoribosyl-AMP cyclohydrolase
MAENKNSSVNTDQIELGTDFFPGFNSQGLLPCIVVDNLSGEVLMFAWMNREALNQTLQTKKAAFFSRSRNKLWVKGETSGRVLHVKQALVDCDQDVIQLKVEVAGEGVCHRGYRSCFYRAVDLVNSGKLKFVEDAPVFNPEDVYGGAE